MPNIAIILYSTKFFSQNHIIWLHNVLSKRQKTSIIVSIKSHIVLKCQTCATKSQGMLELPHFLPIRWQESNT